MLEVTDDAEGDTYRVVYTITFPDAVYVLHAFQKKAKRGIATRQKDLELIRASLRRARMHFEREGASRP